MTKKTKKKCFELLLEALKGRSTGDAFGKTVPVPRSRNSEVPVTDGRKQGRWNDQVTDDLLQSEGLVG